MSYLKGRRIVLGVCGGIAAYKSVELLRLLTKQEALVRVIMTANAERFVGPMTFEALSGHQVGSTLWDPRQDASIHHIQWAREADVIVIAPATANMIGKLANGIADDLLSTFMLAATCPVMVCPSMNSNMYASQPVKRNLQLLKNFGYTVLDPDAGDLACGTVGPGRLPEPSVIADLIAGMLTRKDLRAKNVLVTAGPTHEAIDPVRFITNPSSGRMGYAMARAAEMRGANVLLISGPTALQPPPNVRVTRVTTAAQMGAAVLDFMDHADIIVKCAAVADYRPLSVSEHKIKKNQSQLTLSLERTQDILKEIGARKNSQFVVGFAAETQQLDTYAVEKLNAKNVDMMVGNLIGSPDAGFGSETNRVTLYFKDGTREPLLKMTKEELAHLILDRVVAAMGSRS